MSLRQTHHTITDVLLIKCFTRLFKFTFLYYPDACAAQSSSFTAPNSMALATSQRNTPATKQMLCILPSTFSSPSPPSLRLKKAGSQHVIKLRKTPNFIVPSSSYFSTLWSQKNAVIMKSSVMCWTLNFVLNSFRSGPTRQALVLICTVKTHLEECSRIMHFFYACNTKLYIIKNILIKTKGDKRDVARKEEKYIGSFGRKS